MRVIHGLVGLLLILGACACATVPMQSSNAPLHPDNTKYKYSKITNTTTVSGKELDDIHGMVIQHHFSIQPMVYFTGESPRAPFDTVTLYISESLQSMGQTGAPDVTGPTTIYFLLDDSTRVQYPARYADVGSYGAIWTVSLTPAQFAQLAKATRLDVEFNGNPYKFTDVVDAWDGMVKVLFSAGNL